jgi:hypothetical protein
MVQYSILFRTDIGTVRSRISRGSFWLTHCHQKGRKEISQPGFLDVSRYSVVHPIDLRRVFLCYLNISIRIFDGNGSFPGLHGGLYGQNLPYSSTNLKTHMVKLQNRNFEKSHRTTGPRSDLRPDLWSWENYGIETTFGIIETGKKLSGHQGCFSKRTVHRRPSLCDYPGTKFSSRHSTALSSF